MVYTYLTSMFAMAVRDHLIAVLPCAGAIRLPKVDRGKRVIPSLEQVHQLAALLPARLSAMVYLAAGRGCGWERTWAWRWTTSTLPAGRSSYAGNSRC